MPISEVIKELEKILAEKGDLPVYCCWSETDEDGEEYTVKEKAFIYEAFGEVWVMY
jgi:hypothetical protein